MEAVARRGVPSWLELDKDNYKATVKALPNREELTMPIQEHLIVELVFKVTGWQRLTGLCFAGYLNHIIIRT